MTEIRTHWLITLIFTIHAMGNMQCSRSGFERFSTDGEDRPDAVDAQDASDSQDADQRKDTGDVLDAADSQDAGDQDGADGMGDGDSDVPQSGSLDPSFGNAGQVVIDMRGSSEGERCQALAKGPDDSIVISGNAQDGPSSVCVVAKFDSDGRLIPSFGVDGVVDVPYTTVDTCELKSIKVLSDSKIVGAGHASGFDYLMMKFDAMGNLDASGFGQNGVREFHLGGDKEHFYDLEILQDGSLVVVAHHGVSANSGSGFGRFSASGQPDINVGPDGLIFWAFGYGADPWTSTGQDVPTSIADRGDGSVVIGGYACNKCALLSLHHVDGSRVMTFGDRGVALENVGSGHVCNDVAVFASGPNRGRIVAVGEYCSGGVAESNCDIVLMRFLPDGSLDDIFGTNGFVVTDLAGHGDLAFVVVLQSDGKMVVGGSTHTTGNESTGHWNGAVLRYNPNGSLDTSFDEDGIVEINSGSATDHEVRNLVIQSNGGIVAAGTANAAPNSAPPAESDCWLFRLQP